MDGFAGEKAVKEVGRVPSVAELCDREAIREVIARFSRGVDRGDVDAMKAVYWPDAIDDHGMFVGNGHEFAEFLGEYVKQIEQCQHKIGNMMIDVRYGEAGTDALVETYVWTFMGVNGIGDLIVIGRYLDRLEKRGDVWKIAERTYVMDWNINQDTTVQWEGDLYGDLRTHGGRKPDDPLYALLAAQS